ncbi:MAG: hypothetical protein ACLR4A_16605 [Christensenellales bacterium]
MSEKIVQLNEGSHHKQPKELVRRSAKMPNIFLHAEADEPIQTAALLGHL